jgi:hypothetical protein
MMRSNLGIDVSSIWKDIKTAGGQLVSQLPSEVQRTVTRSVTDKVQQVVTPVAQKLAQEKAERAIGKGNVAMYALGGAVLGALVAGGSWPRRAVGGLAIGAAGTLVAFKMGLLYDQL